MPRAIVGLCIIEFHLPGVSSLKEKRSILKSMLARIHKTFNISAAEVDYQDKWQSSTIAFAVVSNSSKHIYQVTSKTINWIETHYPEAVIVDQQMEVL
jgi:uncharacterized protein YlxP (DUF503 family)